MTRDEVASACGLESPSQYIERTGKGRSTAMLCDAVAAASLGQRVFILAYRERYAQQLTAAARRMATVCGIQKAMFCPEAFEWERDGGLRGLSDPVVMRDHYRRR
jgi:hypothetical protein